MSDQDIWMPLYVRAFLTKTTQLSGEQAGAYLHLLLHSWLLGPLPDDDAKLARMARFSLRVWKTSLRSEVLSFFDLGPSGWTQKRLEIERLKATEISNAARRSANARWLKNKKTNDAVAHANEIRTQYSSPSPSDKKERKVPPTPKGGGSEFDLWWADYPRKDAKDGARRGYAKALKEGATAADLLDGLRRYQFNEDPKFIPMPTTWLNRGSWKAAGELRLNGQHHPAGAARQTVDRRYFTGTSHEIARLPRPQPSTHEHMAWVQAQEGFSYQLPEGFDVVDVV